MDQIKVKRLNTVDAADDISNTMLQAQSKVDALAALEDWELVLASGGEAIPCW